MNYKNRLAKLEAKSETAQGMSNDEMEIRVSRVLRNPALVSPQAYNRIVEILEACKQRQATNES